MTEAVLEMKDSAERKLADLARHRTSGDPDWLFELRSEARGVFQQTGFPTRRIEAWRDTDLSKLRVMDFQVASARDSVDVEGLEKLPFTSLGCPRLVFVNGRFSAALSSDLDPVKGTSLTRLARQIASESRAASHLGKHSRWRENTFGALNLAMFEDGALIEVGKGVEVEQPIHTVFLSLSDGQEGPVAVSPRVLVIAEESSRVSIIESHLGMGDGSYFSNAVTEVAAGNNAVVKHYKVQLEAPGAVHISSFDSTQQRDSKVHTTVVTLGGALIRNETNATMAGEGGRAELKGLYLVEADHHVDNFTRIGHEKPHCDSREVYRGVLADSSKAVFRGRIVVSEGAQQTDSKQTNNNLLLSDQALVNTKPQLEIYADDVKCTHGATVGQLDEDAVFYLQSRGLSRQDARAMLIYAFAGEIVSGIGIDRLREELDRHLLGWLPRRV